MGGAVFYNSDGIKIIPKNISEKFGLLQRSRDDGYKFMSGYQYRIF